MPGLTAPDQADSFGVAGQVAFDQFGTGQGIAVEKEQHLARGRPRAGV